MTQFRVIFMGTPEFAVPALQALHESPHSVDLVVTQPDRPKGRGRRLAEPPVKQAAAELGYPVIQPASVKTEEFRNTIAGYRPDLFVVVAFGHILPKRLLEMPALGAINLHASLLPKYRGPAPIQWAIINGEAETGVTSMLMDAGLDTGEILAVRKTPIHADDTAGTLHDRLSRLSADVLHETLKGFSSGTIRPTPQNHAAASHAPLLKKSDGRLDWHRPADYLERLIRGLSPWPGAYTYWGKKRLNIYRAEVRARTEVASPGTIIQGFENELRVAAGEDALSILEIQGASGRRMEISEFLKGSPVSAGTVLT
ncbi:MAG: methionyl-tRNA formyltransferase [Desulfosalsimonas sp.]